MTPDLQSVLFPEGPQAADIATLATVLFAIAAIVLVVVIAAVAIAVWGSSRLRARLANDMAVNIGGIVFPVVVLSALLGYGIWTTRAAMTPADSGDTFNVAVVGKQWWWAVKYTAPDGTTISSANEVRIPVGHGVTFTLTSMDVIHSFWIPSLGGKVDMIPGRSNRLRLAAERAGIYRGMCAEYCGGAHALMAFSVVAMEEPDFVAWLAAEAAPAREPISAMAIEGRDVFLSAGCGACHTIRGTVAAGTIGPDLTHLGGRRSVGVDTLPMNAANVARFIADGQHIKPNNLMPPFRIFSNDELAALSLYLVGLE